MRVFVIEAAVVIFDQIADMRMINFFEGIDCVGLAPGGNHQYEALVHFSDIPMHRDGIFASRDIVENPGFNPAFFDKIIADIVDVIAMINIGKVINLRQIFCAQSIGDDGGFIFCFSGNIGNEAAQIKQIVCFLSSRPVMV